ncbi:MAG: MATE family efflux transporter, partial [Verrucomicrobiota bacterium]
MPDKTLFQLSFPLLLNAIVGMVVLLVDTRMIAAYSENAAAAVSLANQILLVAFDLSAFFAAGGVVLISRRLGEEDTIGARRIAETAMVGNGIISLLLGGMILVFAPFLIAAINCPPEIVDDAVVYLRVGAFTILFNGIMMAATACLRGFGETRVILVLGLIAYVLYLSSAYVLIFGVGPVPELGVFGSALATLMVRGAAVVALLFVLVWRLSLIPAFWRRSRKGTVARARQMYELSWPGAVDNLAYGIYQVVLVSFIATFNVAMLLSRTFALVISAVLTVVIMAISQANEVMVGYRFGAGKESEIAGCVVRASAVAVVLTTAGAVALWMHAKPLVGLFSDQPQIHELVSQLLWLTIFVQPFSAVNTILFHSLKAMGDVLVPVAGTQAMMWLLSVPAAYLLA